MARAQVCRFYDDATAKKSGALLRGSRRPLKRLPDYDPSAGLYAAMKPHRRAYSAAIPRGAVVQGVALLVMCALIIVPSLEGSGNARPMLSSFLSGSYSGHGSPSVRVNVPANEVRDGISLVAVCMGRPDTLRQTARAWLNVKNVDEIILVDWSSEEPLAPVVRELQEGDRIKIIRVEGEKSWVLSRAYNLAVNASSYANIIRTDCDYAVGEHFVNAHRHLLDSPKGGAGVQIDPKSRGFYYSGNYKLARNENEVHLNGAVFIRRADFLAVGGYDERIQTYGWDDEDLYGRLGASGLEKLNVSYDHVRHVQHGNSGRAQTGVKFVGVEIDLNQLLVDKLEKWSARMRPSVYRVAPVRHSDDKIITISAVSRPKSLRELSSHEEYIKAWDLALGRRLHDTYLVPWDIVSSLKISHKEMLLRRLMMRTENRERKARAELDAAGRANEMVDANKIALPKILLCHCMHGLGNRLRALGSCISFAHETNRELVLVWETDSHIEAKFDELYSSPLVVVEKFPVKWPFHGLEKWDAAWGKFKFHNYMEMEKDGAVKGETIVDMPNKHMYFKGAYIMEVSNSELTNWNKDNSNLRSLVPVKMVSDKLDVLIGRGLGKGNIVGMHIRNRTLAKDIKNVNFVAEYGDRATATMDMWRRKSGVNTFIREMHKLVQQNPGIKFFIATDTFQVISQLEKIFGKDRILSVQRTCDERNGACVQFALVDMYALSKCRSLYGSNWSSFTEAAERLGGLKAKLAGVDFGVNKAA